MTTAENYATLVQRAARLAVAMSVVLLAIKLFAWLLTDSISLFASLADSALDITASLINLLIIRFALKPADEDHNFGHGKLESLAVLIQVLMIIVSAGYVLISAVQRLYQHSQPEHTGIGIVIMAISTLLTMVLILYQRKVIRLTGSQAVRADAAHYRSDLLVNLTVVIALAASYAQLYWADALVALLITGIMLFSVKSIARDAIDTLMDKHLPEEELQRIHQTIKKHDQVLGIHDLRSRRAGNTRFIQFHLELPDSMNLYDAHQIAEDIENELMDALRGADILIHLDPESIVGKERHNSERAVQPKTI